MEHSRYKFKIIKGQGCLWEVNKFAIGDGIKKIEGLHILLVLNR